MRNRLLKTAVYLCLILLPSLCMLMCTGEQANEISGKEISTQEAVISCMYQGLGQRNDTPVVELVFKNKTGRNLSAVYGGIRIIDENGEAVQTTGFTYSRPFAKDEAKKIAAFEYVPLKPEALEMLKKQSGRILVVFRLSEVVFESGESATY